MKKFNVFTIFIFLLAVFVLSSCGGGGDSGEVVDSGTPGEPNLQVTVGDNLRFQETEIRVKAGDKVTLTMNHTGFMGASIMGHNFVLLKQDTDVDAFAQEAVAAGADNEYLPPENDAIIAATEIIGGGESTTITFDAPAEGTYVYICTFPGHYPGMQGELIVE